MNRWLPGWFVPSTVLLLVISMGGIALSQPDSNQSRGDTLLSAQGPLSEKEAIHRDYVVQAALKKRARAIVGRDRTSFMADVDTKDKAFVRAQNRLFDNLAQVRFSYWRHVVTKDGYERPELRAKYGNVRLYLPPVVIHYQIENYDERPVAVPIVPTFIQRGTDWQIAGDSDVDSDLPEGGHAEPWDRREIVVGEGTHVLVLADAADGSKVENLVRVGDAAAARVAQVWPDDWTKKVVISFVRDRRLIETYFRSEVQTSENVAAVAVPLTTEVTNWVNEPPPNHFVELAGYRVIVNPRYFDPDADFNADLLTHEIAHVATGADTWAGAPAWLAEGAAEYTVRAGQDLGVVGLPTSLERQVDAGSVRLPGYDFFNGDVEANYAVGELACRFIVDRRGEKVLRKLYQQLGRTTRELDTLDRQEEVFRSLLGLSTAEFERSLAHYIRDLQ